MMNIAKPYSSDYAKCMENHTVFGQVFGLGIFNP
jgi:hypothetical protein